MERRNPAKSSESSQFLNNFNNAIKERSFQGVCYARINSARLTCINTVVKLAGYQYEWLQFAMYMLALNFNLYGDC